jgi:hypothetical protein
MSAFSVCRGLLLFPKADLPHERLARYDDKAISMSLMVARDDC